MAVVQMLNPPPQNDDITPMRLFIKRNLRRPPVVIFSSGFFLSIGSANCCAVAQTVAFPADLPVVTQAEGMFSFDGQDTVSLQTPVRETPRGRSSVHPATRSQTLEQSVNPEAPELSNQITQVHEKDNLWWAGHIAQPLRPGDPHVTIDLDQLFLLTATHSGRVLAVAQKPWITKMQLAQAQAAFDPNFYGQTRFDSTNEPVENTLTTGGGLPRLEDDILGIDSGLRGTSRKGTNYDLGQQLGHKNSNSTFFQPNDQGTSRLFANLTHPLLRGRKTDVNRTLVLTARFDTQAAQAECQNTLQKQLFAVAEAYWQLYIERATLLQRKRHLERAVEIAERLKHRQSLDSTQTQVLRVNATIANRSAEIAYADARIRNLESRLRSLTNAPELTQHRTAEFVPGQLADVFPLNLDMENEVLDAIQTRPEVRELSSRLDVIRARLGLARDQMKPTLNLVAEGYITGLRGNSNIAGAWAAQFSEGRPGYAAGLVFERPVGNKAAKSRVFQRNYELSQVQHMVDEAVENIRAEVEIAARNVTAAELAAESRSQSLSAVRAELAYLYDRWLTLGNTPRLGTLQLDDLLRAQDRLLEEEQETLRARVQWNLAVLEVQRATGKLVNFSSKETPILGQ